MKLNRVQLKRCKCNVFSSSCSRALCTVLNLLLILQGYDGLQGRTRLQSQFSKCHNETDLV